MSDASSSPVIFISYAYADEPETPAGGEEQWLIFVMKFLQPAVKGGVFEVCGDRQTRGGADWGPEIESKLRACDIFILLMSANAMASDIVDKELAVIRERQKQGKPVHLCALLLTPTPKTGLDKAGDKNLRPRDARPLSASAGHDRAQRMTEVVNEIAEIADGIAKQKNAAQKKAARLAMWRRAIVLGSVVAGALVLILAIRGLMRAGNDRLATGFKIPSNSIFCRIESDDENDPGCPSSLRRHADAAGADSETRAVLPELELCLFHHASWQRRNSGVPPRYGERRQDGDFILWLRVETEGIYVHIDDRALQGRPPDLRQRQSPRLRAVAHRPVGVLRFDAV